MKRLMGTIVVGIFALLLSQTTVLAYGMNSANYQIDWDDVNSGGLSFSSSDNYSVSDTISGVAPGYSSSDAYNNHAGFQQTDDEALMLDVVVRGQDNDTKVAYTAFSDGGLTVTLSDASGYVLDEQIVVVENEGANQLIAFGQITDITSNVVTVDAWDGDNGVLSASPSGGDDYVYRLQGSSVDLGILNSSSVGTAISQVEITTNFSTGYDCYLLEDSDLMAGGNTIDDVTDGTVTAGDNEYGFEDVGADATQSGDVSITSSLKKIANNSGAVTERRTAQIHKAAVAETTPAGTYAHDVTYTCTVKM